MNGRKPRGRVVASLAAAAMLVGTLTAPLPAWADEALSQAVQNNVNAQSTNEGRDGTPSAGSDGSAGKTEADVQDAQSDAAVHDGESAQTKKEAADADTADAAAPSDAPASASGASSSQEPAAAPKATNGSKGLGGDVDSNTMVTDDQIKQLDNVIYAVNAGGTVTDKTTDIGEKPYPYENDSKLPSQSNKTGRQDRPKFKDALIGGKQADQAYADDAAKLNWGYAESTGDNPTKAGGSAENTDSFQSWRQADALQLKDASAAAKRSYDKDGGVVYTFDLPKRERDAQSYTYGVRFGFYVSGNNIPYVRIVANPGDANEKLLRENFPVIGNVKHILTFEHIKPDANNRIVIKFQSNFKLDPENYRGAKPWNKQFTDWDGKEKQDARVSYVEVDAEPTAPATAAELKTALTDVYNLDTDAQRQALLDKIKSNKTSENTRADGSGTADYSSAALADADVKTFDTARNAALKVAADASASTADVIAAYQKVQDAWDGIGVTYDYTSISGVNSARMYATDGTKIQAHGGQIQKVSDVSKKGGLAKYDANKDGTVWIWVGEDKTNGTSALGVHEYVSDDMLNWNNIGLVLPTYQDSVEGKEFSSMPKAEFPDSAQAMAADPDYQAVYGKNFDRFAGDLWNHNLKNADDVYTMLKFDMNVDEGMILERPKLIYNAKTNRWVIWFHCEGSTYGDPTSDSYSKARAGIAVSEGADPTGPFKFLGSFRLDSNRDINGTVNDWSNGYGQVRDMTLFVDDKDANGDGVNDAYVIYTSDGNGAVYASLLNATYTGIASWDKSNDTTKPASINAKAGTEVTKDNGVTYNWIAGASKEAPGVIEHDGKYYLVTSGTAGWAPASAHLDMAEGSVLGEYKGLDSPGTILPGQSDGDTEEWSNFISQNTNLFEIDKSKGLYGYMGNQWFNPDGGYFIADSRYIILPMRFNNGHMEILGATNWNPADQAYPSFSFSKDAGLPTETTSVEATLESLKKDHSTVKLDVEGAGIQDSPITWDTDNWSTDYGDKLEKKDVYTGTATVDATIPSGVALGGKTKLEVNVIDTAAQKNVEYFIDNGNLGKTQGTYYDSLKKVLGVELLNGKADQQADDKSSWGLVTGLDQIGQTTGTGLNASSAYPKLATTGTGDAAETTETPLVYRLSLKAGKHTIKAHLKNTDWYDDSIRSANVVVKSADGTELAKTTVVLNKNDAIKDENGDKLTGDAATAARQQAAVGDAVLDVDIDDKGSGDLVPVTVEFTRDAKQTMHNQPAAEVAWLASYIDDSAKTDVTDARTDADNAAKIEKGDYTDASWDAFQKALAALKSVIATNGVSANQVKDARDALADAKAGLTSKPSTDNPGGDNGNGNGQPGKPGADGRHDANGKRHALSATGSAVTVIAVGAMLALAAGLGVMLLRRRA